MITFTPLAGDAKGVRTAPLSYLLQIDDVHILLDCGSPDWNPEKSASTSAVTADELASREEHWESYCDSLKKHAPSIDLVLLSHGDLAHCGLYPYAYARWGLKAQTYTTLPVQAMGRIATSEDIEGFRDEQDAGDQFTEASEEQTEDEISETPAASKIQASKKDKYVATLQEVHDAFDSVNTLRYSQPTHLQGKCQGLTITPFNAGHTLGGTIWKIRSPTSGTIVYAVNMNHMRERHLDGTVIMRQAAGGVFEPLARPDLLITDADRTTVITSRRKDRDAALLDTITATLSSRCSLLLPCDASTRVLELLVLLDQHWSFSRLRYPICLISKTGSEMLAFVRSMMEWLGGTINKEDIGEDGGNSKQGNKRRKMGNRDEEAEEDALGAFALRFRHLDIFSSPQHMLQKYSSKEPKLILAVPASLSHGPSRTLFTTFAAIPDNVVLLTSKGEEGTLGRQLFDKWNDSQRGDDKWDKGRIGSNIMMDGTLSLTMHSKVPLQGQELEDYLAKERAAKEKEAAQQAAIVRNQRMLEADEDVSDSDSDSDMSEKDEDEDDKAMDTGDDFDQPRTSRLDDVDWDEGLTKQLVSFDIYIKGNVSKSTSFFKGSTTTTTQRFRMFPYIERKRKIDEYGETLDVGMWLRKGKVLEQDAQEEDSKEDKRIQDVDDDAKKAVREPPSKYVTSTVDVQLACRLLFLGMEGLNDGRAVKTIVPQVNPRKMILVHALPIATEALIESCGNIRAMTKDIFAPALGESIQIGQQTNSFSISLSDALLSSLTMSRFEDNEVGFIAGRVMAHSNSIIPTLEPLASKANVPKADLRPATTRKNDNNAVLGSRPPLALPHSTMIGDLKLTALKTRLATVGVQAELIGEGVLICGAGATRRGGSGAGADDSSLGESVAVRKTTKGKVELEGNVSDIYYTVRREIYKLHALVSA